MKSPRLVGVAVALVILGACVSEPTSTPTESSSAASGEPSGSPTERSTSPSTECNAALVLGERAFATVEARAQDYQLVRAENALAGTRSCPGPGCWRLTYKLRELIPTSNPAEHFIGAGGEIFVEVDLASRTARVAGYGE